MRLRWPVMLLLVSFVVFAAPPLDLRPTDWKTISSFQYKWSGNGRPYGFVLRVPSSYDGAGDFTQLQIVRGGKPLLSVTDEDGFARFVDELVSEDMKRLSKTNLLDSPYLLMMPSVKGHSRFPLLFLTGRAYASSPGSLYVISLCDDEIPRQILSLPNFSISAIADIGHDSISEIIGKECESQSVCSQVFTYDPYSVYCFGRDASAQMTLDLGLSKIYNETYYAGWAGIKCREDLAVVNLQKGAKPIIMDAKEAQKHCGN